MLQLPKPYLTLAVDTIIIAVTGGSLQVLLVQRSDVKKDLRVLPGGFVGEKETLLAAAKRKLEEETGYNKFAIHQVGLFDAVERDPRGRVISVAFLAVVHKTNFPFKDGPHTRNARFVDIKQLPKLGFDHKDIIKAAVKHLQNNIMHTDIAKSLLPKYFTLTQLQTTYEVILGKSLNVRNFRKKVIDIELIKATGEIEIGVGHRPAQYYKFA